MEIIDEIIKDIKVFHLKGRLDSNTSPLLETAIIQAVEGGLQKIVVDFEQLEYVSSAGLRVILKATKDLKRLSGELILCSMQDYVKEVFEIAGFDTFLPIVSSFKEVKEKYGIT